MAVSRQGGSTRYGEVLTVNASVRKRETFLGRWTPLVFYGVNLGLWTVIGWTHGAEHLLWLVVWPLPAGLLYGWRHWRGSR